jgi:hypothetical protein
MLVWVNNIFVNIVIQFEAKQYIFKHNDSYKWDCGLERDHYLPWWRFLDLENQHWQVLFNYVSVLDAFGSSLVRRDPSEEEIQILAKV